MLGFLLARAGLDVVVLEKQADFFRDFRGDAIHPSTLVLLGELGLRERFLAIDHDESVTLDAVINGNRLHPVNFAKLPAPDNFIAFMPQWDFLNFLAQEGGAYPEFRLLQKTEATGLITEGTVTTGVRAVGPGGKMEIPATLTVAADGRASTIRDSAGAAPVEFGVPIDVLWFRLPRPDDLAAPTLAYIDENGMIITIDRGDYFQVGMVIPRGGFDGIRARGIDLFRANMAKTAPPLAGVVDAVDGWDAVKLLSVQINRLDRWHQPGLLYIGDAAHAMSPAFGVGINYAIQDAVQAANALVGAFATGAVDESTLAAVQSARMPAIARMQRIQMRAHETIARPGGALLPDPMRRWQQVLADAATPLLQRFTARMIGRGFHPVRLSPALQEPPGSTRPVSRRFRGPRA